MTARPWPVREKTRLLSTHVFHVDRYRLGSPRTGEDHEFHIIDCPDWCNVVALTPNHEVVMVRQQRHGIGADTLELPGGMIDPSDASPLAAAERELLEETGYRGSALQPLGVIAPNPAMQTNRSFSFFARDAVRVAALAQDRGEDIAVELVPYAEIPTRIARGEFTHALVVVAFAYALGLQPPR